ncbi:MAG TPA: diguanylate cyclase [Anaerolineales bacterium]|nr:diguanylate cyclase [Anaerolineales bacterium]
MKVLLYETDETIINLLREHLNQEDYDLLIEKDESNLLQHFEKDLPDMVISNFDLPLGGIELVNNILALLKPPFPYVIFLTNPESEQYAVDCLGPIPGDFVSKPIRSEELHARITVAERAIALQNHLRAQNELPADIAMYDNLTNLLNRQAVYERVLGEVNRSHREKSPSCLTLFEIVNINEIEEQYGSKISDQAIRFVARAIRANIRMYDILGRWMGARFLLMLPGLRRDYVSSVVGRIYGAIHSVRIRLEDDTLLPLKVATGYTTSGSADPIPLYMMIEQANAALVHAAELQEELKITGFSSIKDMDKQ